jgi:crotonobetaine/carnitine-CoA ligase
MDRQLASVDPAAQCVLRYALEHHAAQRPDTTFAVFESGATWTFAETLRHAAGTASALQSLGVAQGSPVLLLLPNSETAVRTLFAINYLGAVAVPVNPAFKGRLLEHVVKNCAAKIAVVHPDVVPELERIDTAQLEVLILSGAAASTNKSGALRILDENVLLGSPDTLQPLERPIAPWDTQTIIYTSGTTGPSKGVLSSYMHAWSAAGPLAWPFIRNDDRHLVHMPLFHIGGTFMCINALLRGGSIAVVSGFRTQSFWQLVAQLEVTAAFLLGTMATFLLKQEPMASDRSHKLRVAFIVPLGTSAAQFRERFGIDVYTVFNMTEISTPLHSGPNPAKPNMCGRPRKGVSVRLVDEHDCEVPTGKVGELIVRTDQPWAMNHGYHRNPEATASAWRNGWFHTGDAFVVDEEGDFFFVDRLKDMIRRRGENISAYELEVELLGHPSITEAAAVPVASAHGEDDVMVVLVLKQGAKLDQAELIEYLDRRIARFMLPRYIRIVDRLPMTPTMKVQKQALRSTGLTADTWDRDAHGIIKKSTRFD